MTKDEAQHRRWTFYEAVNVDWEKMKKHTYDLEERLLEYSVLDIRFSFDVGRSMFDVHLSKQPLRA